MGGRKPKAPQIVSGNPPKGGRPNIPNLFQPLKSATTRGRGGRETEPGYAIGPADGIIPYVNDPRLKGRQLDYSQSPYRNIRNQYQQIDQPTKGDIGIGGSPSISPKVPPRDGPLPKFPREPRRRKRKGNRRLAGRRMAPGTYPSTLPPFPKDLGESPEREVPIPPEIRERITRRSDPRGPAPFMPKDTRKRDRFFEERSDRRAQRRSDRKDRREEFMNEINVGREQRAMQREEKRDIARSRREERRMRQDENRGRRRNFRRRRSRMERRRSRRERAAFRDRFVSTLRR